MRTLIQRPMVGISGLRLSTNDTASVERQLAAAIIAVFRLLNEVGLPFLDDFPLTLAILSLNCLLWFEDALDDHAFIRLDEGLWLGLLGWRLCVGSLVELLEHLGFILLGVDATILLSTALVLLLLHSLNGAGEPLLSGLRSRLLLWRCCLLLRFVPGLAFFDLFLYSLSLVVVVFDVVVVV